MYSLLNSSNKKAIYENICDDIMGHIVSFLGDEEKVEWCHINRKMLQYIREYSPHSIIEICTKCQHHKNNCTCRKCKFCCQMVGLLFSVGIIILSIILMILNYHHII